MIGGSTLVLHSAAIEMAEYKSLDGTGHEVTLDNLQSVPNTILFAADTVFRISSTTLPGEGGREVYGAVSGYSYMGAADRAAAYARRG